MKSKNESGRHNKKIKAFLIIMILAIIVGATIYIKSHKKENIEDKTNNHISTEEMKEQAPLIDMNNTENAKIENGEKVNLSENLKKEKKISGLKITNIKLHTESGISYFNAIVENISEKDYAGGIVNLKFKKSDDSVLANVEASIPAIKVKGKGLINASTTADIVNAADVELE